MDGSTEEGLGVVTPLIAVLSGCCCWIFLSVTGVAAIMPFDAAVGLTSVLPVVLPVLAGALVSVVLLAEGV